MDEQKPQLNKPSATPSEPQEKPVEQDAPFYNVMPQAEAQGPMIGPKIKIAQETNFEAHDPNPVIKFAEAHKRLVILVLAILLLAYPAYYLLNKLLPGQPEEENLLSEEALKLLQGGANSNPPEELAYKTPKEWQARYFGSELCQTLESCGDEADPDRDGLKNLEEFEKETDPNNNDSDQDGLSDGDEVNVFSSSPTNKSTSGDEKYSDADYIKGGYNPNSKDTLLDAEQILDISAKMKSFGLHQPTITTLGDSLLEIYKFTAVIETAPNATSTDSSTATTTESSGLEGLEQTPEAKQDGDTQRSNAIKNIAIALVKYSEDKSAFPITSDFAQMFAAVKIYTRVATNPTDPVNKGKYVYTYAATEDGKDFTLTFFSESQNQIIRTTAADAKKYQTQEQAAIYDEQRKNNLDSLRTALLLYSNNNIAGNQEYVFPKNENYQTALVPEFISEIPKDPKTGEVYEYQVAETFDSFTLKAILDAPPTGRTGYLCNQEECRYY